MKAPLTSKKIGSVRCTHCEQRFNKTPGDEVIEVETTDYVGARPGYKANTLMQVMRRWHKVCFEQFEEQNRKLEEARDAENNALIESLKARAAAQAAQSES